LLNRADVQRSVSRTVLGVGPSRKAVARQRQPVKIGRAP